MKALPQLFQVIVMILSYFLFLGGVIMQNQMCSSVFYGFSNSSMYDISMHILKNYSLEANLMS